MTEVPAALDYEQEFLNHLVRTDSLEEIMRDGLDSDVLHSPVVKAAYAFAKTYYTKHPDAPTAEIISDQFEGLSHEFTEPQVPVDWLVARLRHRYKKNQYYDLVIKLSERQEDPDEGMKLLHNEFVKIERATMSQKHVWGPGDHKLFLTKFQEDIFNGQYKGATTGFKEIDEFTGGYRPGHLIGYAARPKRKKTFLILKTFIEMVRNGDNPILFPLENTVEEIMNRIQCIISGYPWDLAQKGIIPTAKDWELLRGAWEEFDSWGTYHIVRPIEESERTVSAMALQADKVDAGPMLISQFEFITASDRRFYADHERWGSIVADLKNAALRGGKERPIVVETQLNREAASIKEMQGMDLAHLGLTDRWGKVADALFALTGTQEQFENGLTEFGIIEARNYGKKSWLLQTQFSEQTKIEYYGSVEST